MIKIVWQHRPARYLLAGAILVVLFAVGAIFLLPPRPLVYSADLSESQTEPDVSSYILKKSDKNLPLTADAYVVTDLENNETVINKNDKKILPIASITKLVTALVAQEFLKPDQIITISQQAYDTYGNSGNLHVGQKISKKDIFYPLLLSSSNDAAEALAETVGRDKFIAEMNNRVKKIGLTDTFFADPSGLSPLNISTASDLAKLAGYLYQSQPELLAITREQKHQVGKQSWHNVNNISLLKYYVGGKNGYTDEANRTLVSIFNIPITSTSTAGTTTAEKKSRLLAIVLLQSDDRKGDAKGLLNYLTRYVSYLGGKNGFVPIL